MRSLISFLSSFPSVFIHTTTVIGYFLIVLIYTLIGTFGVDFFMFGMGWSLHWLHWAGLHCI